MKKIFILIFLLSSAESLFAIGFGKNNVNYFEFEWAQFETEHFEVYLPDELLFLSNRILCFCEETYDHHKTNLGMTNDYQITVVVYNNQVDFQQNNITGGIDEGTGGFTEFIQGRVVVPYSGNLSYFEHVLSHELTHAVQGLIWGNGHINRLTLLGLNIPLWMIEGMAEFNSIGIDAQCEMMVREALLGGTLPTLAELSDLYTLETSQYYFVYKEGQIFYEYLTETYGQSSISNLNAAIAYYKDIDMILADLFEMDMDELNAHFHEFLLEKYAGSISNTEEVLVGAESLVEESSYNLAPVYLSTNTLLFLTERFYTPMIVSYDTNKDRFRRLVRGGLNEDYLEFHFGERINLSLSEDGVLCFISRSGGSDLLYLYDTETKESTSIETPFRMLSSPEISADGSKILFSAENENHVYDIYLYNIESGEIAQITDDEYYNNAPRFLGENRIVFTSNRRTGNEDSDIILWNLESGVAELLIDSGESDAYPVLSPDQSKLAFVSVGADQKLLLYDLESGSATLEFSPRGGIYTPSFSPDGEKIAFSAYSDATYNLFEIEIEQDEIFEGLALLSNGQWTNAVVETNEALADAVESPYRLKVGLDNLLGAFTLSTEYGFSVLGYLSMSDVLGNHNLFFLADTTLKRQTNAGEYLNLYLSYSYLKKRTDFSFILYHYSNYFFELSTLSSFYEAEAQYDDGWGVLGEVSYPFSTFSRLDLQLGVKGLIFSETNTLTRPHLKLSFVHDDTLSSVIGPLDGRRLNLSLEAGFPIFADSLSYQRLILDYRSYVMLYPGYSFAFRFVGGKMLGRDKDDYPFEIGGYNSVRGHTLGAYKGDTTFVANLEFRFPMITSWSIGFPIPIEMPTIWGVIFFDMGAASDWNNPDFELWTRDTNENLIFTDLKAGFGFGFRILLGSEIKLMVDFATPYDAIRTDPLSAWESFWQIGVEF